MRAFPSVCLLLSCAAAAAAAQQAPQPAANGTSPIVSPDGRRVLFTATREGSSGYYVVSEDGSGTIRVATRTGVTGRPAWSANGARLVTSVIEGDTIRVSSLSLAGDATPLGVVSAKGARAAVVSPDGRQIVYGAGAWTEMQLFAATLGGPSTQITQARAAFWCHSISPDGKQVAAARNDSTRQMQIWVMNIDGSDARPVTRFARADGSPQCPSWSADARRIAVASAVADPSDAKKQIGNIWIVDVATGAATKLAPHTTPYLDEVPSWFPDGKRIAFQSDRTGQWEIWTMNVDGSGVRQLTR